MKYSIRVKKTIEVNLNTTCFTERHADHWFIRYRVGRMIFMWISCFAMIHVCAVWSAMQTNNCSFLGVISKRNWQIWFLQPSWITRYNSLIRALLCNLLVFEVLSILLKHVLSPLILLAQKLEMKTFILSVLRHLFCFTFSCTLELWLKSSSSVCQWACPVFLFVESSSVFGLLFLFFFLWEI